MKYTQNKQSRFTKKSLLITAVGILLLVGAAFAVWFFFLRTPSLEEINRQETNHVDETSGIKEEQVKSGENEGSNLPNKAGSGDESSVDTSAPTPQTPPEKPQLQRASGNPTIRVVATFQNASDGYCELSLTNGSLTQTKIASINVSSSYYTCTFDIPRDSLQPQSGWKISVVHHIGEAKTSSDIMELK